MFLAQERGTRVTATVVTAQNHVRTVSLFNVMELSRRSLKAGGLPTRYAGLGRRSDRPGSYIAVAAPIRGKLAFFGADAVVLAGKAPLSIIGLDPARVGRPFTLALPLILPPPQMLR